MAENNRSGASALILGGLLALSAGLAVTDEARAQDAVVSRPAVRTPATRAASVRPRGVRTAAARPLTIRPRAERRPVDIVGGPGAYGDEYLLRPHAWNDPRLYYFGPFRTGGEVFYGDQAGDPGTRGNAGLGQVAGYGPARGGFGGPHFDTVGGFHNGPGPDAKIDDDYASGSLSRPDYVGQPRYPSVKQQASTLSGGAVPRGDTTPVNDHIAGRRLMAEGRSTGGSFEEAKAQFAAPMKRQAPVEAGFANGGVKSMGLGDDAF